MLVCCLCVWVGWLGWRLWYKMLLWCLYTVLFTIYYNQETISYLTWVLAMPHAPRTILKRLLWFRFVILQLQHTTNTQAKILSSISTWRWYCITYFLLPLNFFFIFLFPSLSSDWPLLEVASEHPFGEQLHDHCMYSWCGWYSRSLTQCLHHWWLHGRGYRWQGVHIRLSAVFLSQWHSALLSGDHRNSN